MVPADAPSEAKSIWDIPVLALGFRPFFLLGAIQASLALLTWIASYGGYLRLDEYGSKFNWHSHEMLFGFSTAIVAGFLLTAVGNWTRVKMPHGRYLAILALLWISGRLAMLAAVIPAIALDTKVVMAIDLAFIPALGVALALPIIKTKNTRNLVFIPLFAILTLANTLFHLGVLGVLNGAYMAKALNGVLHVIVMMMVLIGGRVLPFFTRNGLKRAMIDNEGIKNIEIADKAALWLVGAMIIADLIFTNSVYTGWIALFAGISVLVRMTFWASFRTLKVPLLWVLHISYFFVGLGLVAKFLALVPELIDLTVSTHTLTVGGIGIMTLGMMSRVSLGHTGRGLFAGKPATVSFVLITLAAVIRVGTPLIAPALYGACVTTSGVLYSLSFTIFVFAYWGILTSPRVDGRPG